MSVLIGDSQQPDDSNESYIQTQQMTQTQQANSQNDDERHSAEWDNSLWGMLIAVSLPTAESLLADAHHAADSSRPAKVEFRVGKDEYLVGRHPRADLHFDSQKISSKHARIFRDTDDQVKLEDTSTNGTYVRGSKVGKHNVTVLETGDEIVFGSATVTSAVDLRYIFRGPNCDSRASRPWGIRESSGGGIHEKYEVREQVGKGSFATVRKGIQRSTGKMVAIKIIQKARWAASPKTMEMIRREVEIMKRLDHEYCVRYIDYFEDEQRMWLVMEYVDGGDLLEYVMKSGGLPEDETREIATMVCQAVAYLHSKGVAHRDLKPENLLISSGQRPVCKVTDFGLAKMVDGNTMLKTMCGTPTYLAPEVILGQSPSAGYDAIVDAWSIGVILFSCLSNQIPFDQSEDKPLQEQMRTRTIDWTALDEFRISKDGKFVLRAVLRVFQPDGACKGLDFLGKLLQKDPRKRMRVADALSHKWLAGTAPSGFLSSANLSKPALKANPSLSAASKAITTTNASSGSFGYSQGLERMRLDDTPVRSAAQMLLEATGEHSREDRDEVMNDADHAIGKSTDIKSIGVPSPPTTNFFDLSVAGHVNDEDQSQEKRIELKSAFSSDSSENASGASRASAMSARPNGSLPFDIPAVVRQDQQQQQPHPQQQGQSENDRHVLSMSTRSRRVAASQPVARPSTTVQSKPSTLRKRNQQQAGIAQANVAVGDGAAEGSAMTTGDEGDNERMTEKVETSPAPQVTGLPEVAVNGPVKAKSKARAAAVSHVVETETRASKRARTSSATTGTNGSSSGGTTHGMLTRRKAKAAARRGR